MSNAKIDLSSFMTAQGSKENEDLSVSEKRDEYSSSETKESLESLDLFIQRLAAFEQQMRHRVLKRSDSLQSVCRVLVEKIESLFSDTIVIRFKKKLEKGEHYLLWMVLYTHHCFFCSFGAHVLWSKEKKQIYLYKKLEQANLNLPSPHQTCLYFPQIVPFLKSEDFFQYEAHLKTEYPISIPSLHPQILYHQLRYKPSPSTRHHHRRPPSQQPPKQNKNHPKYYKHKKRSSRKVNPKDVRTRLDRERKPSSHKHKKHFSRKGNPKDVRTRLDREGKSSSHKHKHKKRSTRSKLDSPLKVIPRLPENTKDSSVKESSSKPQGAEITDFPLRVSSSEEWRTSSTGTSLSD
jgi:hypothetical protein